MTRAERDNGLITALRSVSAPVAGAHGTRSEAVWAYADDVARHARTNGLVDADLTAIGAGLILSRLGREGRIDAYFEGAFTVYRHLDWRPTPRSITVRD